MLPDITSKLQKGYISLVLIVFALLIAAIIYLILGFNSALGFVVGAISSAVAGLIGMSVAVRANVRCAEAAKKGLVAPARQPGLNYRTASSLV